MAASIFILKSTSPSLSKVNDFVVVVFVIIVVVVVVVVVIVIVITGTMSRVYSVHKEAGVLLCNLFCIST